MVRILRWLTIWAWRLGGQSAVESAVGTAVDAVPRMSQSYTQVFNVKPPITVYVRGSQCRVTVRRDTEAKVILQAAMYRTFGLEFAADQDDAGVYIIARQKPVVGKLSRADFTITVPTDSQLVFHLTPGEVVIEDVDGMLELPPAR